MRHKLNQLLLKRQRKSNSSAINLNPAPILLIDLSQHLERENSLLQGWLAMRPTQGNVLDSKIMEFFTKPRGFIIGLIKLENLLESCVAEYSLTSEQKQSIRHYQLAIKKLLVKYQALNFCSPVKEDAIITAIEQMVCSDLFTEYKDALIDLALDSYRMQKIMVKIAEKHIDKPGKPTPKELSDLISTPYQYTTRHDSLLNAVSDHLKQLKLEGVSQEALEVVKNVANTFNQQLPSIENRELIDSQVANLPAWYYLLELNVNNPLANTQNTAVTYFGDYLTQLLATKTDYFEHNDAGFLKAKGNALITAALSLSEDSFPDPKQFIPAELEALFALNRDLLWLVLESTMPVSGTFTCLAKINVYLKIALFISESKLEGQKRKSILLNLVNAAFRLGEECSEGDNFSCVDKINGYIGIASFINASGLDNKEMKKMLLDIGNAAFRVADTHPEVQALVVANFSRKAPLMKLLAPHKLQTPEAREKQKANLDAILTITKPVVSSQNKVDDSKAWLAVLEELNFLVSDNPDSQKADANLDEIAATLGTLIPSEPKLQFDLTTLSTALADMGLTEPREQVTVAVLSDDNPLQLDIDNLVLPSLDLSKPTDVENMAPALSPVNPPTDSLIDPIDDLILPTFSVQSDPDEQFIECVEVDEAIPGISLPVNYAPAIHSVCLSAKLMNTTLHRDFLLNVTEEDSVSEDLDAEFIRLISASMQTELDRRQGMTPTNYINEQPFEIRHQITTKEPIVPLKPIVEPLVPVDTIENPIVQPKVIDEPLNALSMQILSAFATVLGLAVVSASLVLLTASTFGLSTLAIGVVSTIGVAGVAGLGSIGAGLSILGLYGTGWIDFSSKTMPDASSASLIA